MEQELLTGDLLRKFVFEERVKIPAIAENFIYQKSIIMIVGDPGVGKSILLANVGRDLSLGIPVFNFFHTPQPAIFYYVPFERGAYEIADRLQSLSSVVEPNWKNIVIKPNFIGFDISEINQFNQFVTEVSKDLDMLKSSGFQIVFATDPIISMVSGEIKEEKFAKCITRACNTIQSNSGCALILANHTVKGSEKKKDKTKIDPFYGSQAFKAFATSGIYVYRDKTNGGIQMHSTKSSHGNSIDNVHLAYDDFTGSLYGKLDESGVKNYDKILATVRAIQLAGFNNFTYANVHKHSLCKDVSVSSVKSILLTEEPFKSCIKVETGIGKPTLLSFISKV